MSFRPRSSTAAHPLPGPRPLARRATAGLAAAALALAGLAALTPAAAHAADGAEQIVNGSFDGLAGWTIYPGGANTDGAGCNTVPAGSAPYSAAIQQEFAVTKGTSYELTFRAKASPAVQGPVRVIVQGGPDVNYEAFLPPDKPSFGTGFAGYTYYFTADRDYPNAQLAFQQDITNTAGYEFCVDDVSVTGGAQPPAYAPDTGPRVRVNQVGYLPGGPKGATLVTDRTTPVPWQLRRAGKVVASGQTAPRGVDPSAGLNVATIDFSAVRTSGTDYTLTADGDTSYPFTIGMSGADERLRTDAMTFFYTNRSGIPISNSLEPGYGRLAGHVGVAPNQGDRAVGCQALDDDSQKLLVAHGDQPWTCDRTTDVSGGWYDAGDHGKYVVNGGIALGQLLTTYERSLTAPTADRGAFADGSLAIPENHNGIPDILDEARWEMDFFLKMQVRPGQQYAGMAYHKVADTDWTGLPLAPAADPMPRVLYRPSTAATLNLAATAAQAARLARPYDRGYAARLLAAARTAYAAAKANPALYAPPADAALDPNPGSGPYDDDDVSDEFFWAASELAITTGEPAYLADVTASPFYGSVTAFPHDGFAWNEVAALGAMDLATVPSRVPAAVRSAERAAVRAAADRLVADQATQPFGTVYVPADGQYAWGSNSNILNDMVVLGTAYDLSGAVRYRDTVLGSADYLLGRNALNRSYITGYGEVSSQNQHTRMYAHQDDPSLPHPPDGTVAGGPNSTTTTTGDPITPGLFPDGCAAQFCYVDDIGSYSTNEITVNWNAPLEWVASFVADLDGIPGR